MKYLIMCEGPNELQIINILLEHEKLVLGRDDLSKEDVEDNIMRIESGDIAAEILDITFGQQTTK